MEIEYHESVCQRCRQVKIRPFRYGNEDGYYQMREISQNVKIRPFRYGNVKINRW